MKRMATALGTAALLAALSAAAAAATTINFYAGKDTSGANRALVDRFNESQSKIKVVLQEMPPSTSEQHDKYVTVLAARDSSIDVLAADIPWAPEFAAAGWLLPLGKYVDQADLNDLFDGPKLGTTFRRELYAIPWFNNAGVLYYRKDLLANGGAAVPQTYNELVAAAQKLQKGAAYGYIWQGAQYEGGAVNWFEIFWGMGGQFLDADGKLTASKSVVANSLRWLGDTVHKYNITPPAVTTWKEAEGQALFLSGRGVFHRGWPSVYARSLDAGESKVVGQVGIAPMVGQNGPGSTTLGTWNLAISRFSKHPKEAWEFVEFMISPEAQELKAIMGGNPPVRKSVFSDPDLLAKYPHFKSLYSVFDGARPRPVDPAYPQISAEAIQPNFAAVMAQSKSPEQAAEDLLSTTERILSRARR